MIKCFGDLVQTYGVMVAQQILVLLVEVRIPIGLQASKEFSFGGFLFPSTSPTQGVGDVRGYRYAVLQTETGILAMNKTNSEIRISFGKRYFYNSVHRTVMR